MKIFCWHVYIGLVNPKPGLVFVLNMYKTTASNPWRVPYLCSVLSRPPVTPDLDNQLENGWWDGWRYEANTWATYSNYNPPPPPRLKSLLLTCTSPDVKITGLDCTEIHPYPVSLLGGANEPDCRPTLPVPASGCEPSMNWWPRCSLTSFCEGRAAFHFHTETLDIFDLLHVLCQIWLLPWSDFKQGFYTERGTLLRLIHACSFLGKASIQPSKLYFCYFFVRQTLFIECTAIAVLRICSWWDSWEFQIDWSTSNSCFESYFILVWFWQLSCDSRVKDI